MKWLWCRIWSHKWDTDLARQGVDMCERCGMEDPPLHGLWWFWCGSRDRLWRWYSWVFIPCRWCGRFEWDPRGHKSSDGPDDCRIPF